MHIATWIAFRLQCVDRYGAATDSIAADIDSPNRAKPPVKAQRSKSDFVP